MARKKMKFAAPKFISGDRVNYCGISMLPCGEIVRLAPRKGTIVKNWDGENWVVKLDGETDTDVLPGDMLSRSQID